MRVLGGIFGDFSRVSLCREDFEFGRLVNRVEAEY